jgi:formylglycine-generating enzyme required for sulfatase activity
MTRRAGIARRLGVVLFYSILSTAPQLAVAEQPGETFKDCPQCPEMVVVPAGQFTMGSPETEEGRSSNEGPQHVRRFPEPFAVSKFHVTVDQFAAFQHATGHDAGESCWTLEDGKAENRNNRSWKNPGFPQQGNHPVVCLNWPDAKAYIAWLSEKTGKKYRLLTESEFEYAARAGSTTRYFFGEDASEFCRYGNGGDLTTKEALSSWAQEKFHLPCRDGYVFTAPVGAFLPNAFGLHDMHGNAWTWVNECSSFNYRYSASDASPDATPYQLATCQYLNRRGGAWDSPQSKLRSAARFHSPPNFYYRGATSGLRIGRSL